MTVYNVDITPLYYMDYSVRNHVMRLRAVIRSCDAAPGAPKRCGVLLVCDICFLMLYEYSCGALLSHRQVLAGPLLEDTSRSSSCDWNGYASKTSAAGMLGHTISWDF